MKAFVFERPGAGQVREVERLQPGPGQVLLKVESCGVCGTDVHIWHGNEPAAHHVILGHEFAGTVAAVGEGVTAYQPVDRVAVDPNIACGVCSSCQEGRVNLCTRLKALGVDLDGGFAEYCLAPATQLYPLPAQVSWDEAAMIEPLACALHGIDRAEVAVGTTVLVIGGGPIGLLMLQLAKLRGADRLILSERLAKRRELGAKYGADLLLDPEKGQLSDQIPEGERPHVVIECVGRPETQAEAVRVARRGGTVLLFGCGPLGKVFPMDSFEIYSKELSVKGSALNPFTHLRALRLIAEGRLDVGSLVTRAVPLAELPALLATGIGEDDLKVVVHPA